MVGGVGVEWDGLPVDGRVPDLEAHGRVESCQDALPCQYDPLHVVARRVNVLWKEIERQESAIE